MRRFLEAGRLNSPRGIKGELRFDCWCDSLEFLQDVQFLYLDPEGKKALEVKEFRLTVSTVTFVGYEEREIASSLTGRTVYFDRNDVEMPEGSFFYDDMLGADAFDADTGEKIGSVVGVDEGASSFFYRVRGEQTDYYIPDVSEYVISANPEKGISFRRYAEFAEDSK